MVTFIPYTMDSVISKTLQEAGDTGAEMAPKPFSYLKIKSSSGGARRALTSLGTNNTKLNLSMAHSNLAIAQEEFQNMWNFNPIKEAPLPHGRFQWEALSSLGDKEVHSTLSEVVEKDITLLKDITNPILASFQPSVTLEVTDLKTTQDGLKNNDIVPSSNITKYVESDDDDISDCENRKQVPKSSRGTILVSTKSVLTKSQMCITEYFRPQKRKTKYHCDASQPITPLKKKLRTIH